MTDDRLTLTVDETAARLGVSRGLIYGLIRRHELAAIRLGRRVVIPTHAVDELLRAAS